MTSYREVDRAGSFESTLRRPVRVSVSPVSGRTQIGSQISIGPGWQLGAGWQQGASVRHGTGAKPGQGLHSPLRVGGGMCQPWQPTAPAKNNRIVKLTPPRICLMVCMPVLSGTLAEKICAAFKKRIQAFASVVSPVDLPVTLSVVSSHGRAPDRRQPDNTSPPPIICLYLPAVPIILTAYPSLDLVPLAD